MSESAVGAAVAEARRVLALKADGGSGTEILILIMEGHAICAALIAADAALAAWERWVSLRASGLSMSSTLTEYDEAVRLTAEARGK